MARKAAGPNGIAITRSDTYPTDEDLIDRAMQVGHREPSSVLANREKRRPHYVVQRGYSLDPASRAEDMWFVVAEDFADQYNLTFDGIEHAHHAQTVICRFASEKYVVDIAPDESSFHKAIRSVLATYHLV